MKRTALIFLVLFLFGFVTFSWGQCPEDPNDRGECDTLHVVPYQYAGLAGFPATVTVKLLVTHDQTVATDSIKGFVIPLAYTHTNSSKYCSLSGWWNTVDLHPWPNLDRSIFRNLEITPGDSIRNRMMTMAYGFGPEWDFRQLIVHDTNDFWLCSTPTGTPDQLWWEGNRVLLATMTFRVEDTMTICIDSTFWYPSSILKWSRSDAVTYFPRHNMPICFKVDTAASSVREIQGSDDSRPSEFFLSQNYPNPFNPATNFEFSLSLSAHVKIDIFNIVGQKVRTLVDEEMKPGVYVADWDGKDENGKPVSSGIYFYRMEAGEFSDMKKMVLVK
ncbi:MAG: T9SS type A sorting domain-containing protein [candidate division Zixibacteria bacterium]|nr:T9SS type A sorting domain-containing protein [candidate division Zixibacteria bacterium]